MTQFDLSTLNRTEADELYSLVCKYQRSDKATYDERGWCAGILDKLFSIIASGTTTFPVCDADYTTIIHKAYALK